MSGLYASPFTYNEDMQLFLSNNNSSNELGSPLMSTPFLESSQTASPFADPIGDRSPYAMFASFSESPTFSTYTTSSTTTAASSTLAAFHRGGYYQQPANNDIFIAGYLDKPDFYQQPSPKQEQMAVKNFNGDQTLLIIDKSKLPAPVATMIPAPPLTSVFGVAATTAVKSESKLVSPTVRLNTITEEDLDTFLFPPLTSSQESCFDSSYKKNTREEEEDDRSLDELLGYTDSPLSQPMEDEEEEEARKEESKQESKQETTSTSNNKRKRSSSSSEEMAPQKKRQNKDKKKFQCEICGLVSKRKYNLTTHIKTHDKNRVKDFSCNQCAKSFDRRHDRDRHLATVHRHERSFACRHCKSHFSRGDALNRHLVAKHDYDEHDFEEH
ncbi:hypothetical protein INT47_006349 [Mucor saturninus]|uniref:C2H2-type domain-containing protein n=1 Tax=Mucor saturninus TaxID=64648 RepID=A0A8H7RGW8_9FUNG|nr:hypothetical protein INT47_006349 [Mucor saturninus]